MQHGCPLLGVKRTPPNRRNVSILTKTLGGVIDDRRDNHGQEFRLRKFLHLVIAKSNRNYHWHKINTREESGDEDSQCHALLFNHCHAALLVGRTTPNYMQNHWGETFDLKSSKYKLDFYQTTLFRRLNSILGKLVSV